MHKFNYNIQYQTHLILNSKYSFLIKLMIMYSLSFLFYLKNFNEIAFCIKENLAEAHPILDVEYPIADVLHLQNAIGLNYSEENLQNFEPLTTDIEAQLIEPRNNIEIFTAYPEDRIFCFGLPVGSTDFSCCCLLVCCLYLPLILGPGMMLYVALGFASD